MYKQPIASRFTIFTLLFLLFMTACGASDDFAGEAFEEESFGFAVEPSFAPQVEFETASSDAMDMAFNGDEGARFMDEQLAASQERLVIKNADLTIVVNDPAEAMADISVMAVELEGFVVFSNLYQTQLESGVEIPAANITIRVPDQHFQQTLEQIEADANRTLSKNESGQDITREYTDLNSRLRNLESTAAQLREIMASATKTEDVLSVFYELSRVSGEIEMVKGQIQYFDQSVAFSVISVNILAEESVQPLTIGAWQPVGVAKDAIQSLINTVQALVNIVIWSILYILPTLLVITLPIWLIWRGIKKSRTKSTNSSNEIKSDK